MYNKNNLVAEGAPVKTRESKKQRSVYRHSLEYEIIVNLILKQYEINEAIRFDLLWAIQESDRIPALTNEFGKKRIHNLMSTVLREFCLSIPLPKAKKLNDTRTNACACDIMIRAEEEALSMEDIILFFERAKKGKYGPINKYLTHQLINEKLEMYLEDRRQAFIKFSEEKHLQYKGMGPADRICREPKQIGEIINQAIIIEMNRKMSG